MDSLNNQNQFGSSQQNAGTPASGPTPVTSDFAESEISQPYIAPNGMPAAGSVTQIPRTNAEEVVIRPLRTYKDDVKEAIGGQNLSTARIMMAEQQRRNFEDQQRVSQSIEAPKNQLFLFATIILVAAALAVFGYLFIYKKYIQPTEQTDPIITRLAPELISIESQAEVFVGDRSNLVVFAEAEKIIETPFAPKTIKELLFTRTERFETEDGATEKKVTLTTEQFLALLSVRAPEAFIRALDPNFTFGVYATEDYNDPFILFKVNDHDNAYGNMFTWETQLAQDLKPIFKSFNGTVLPDEYVRTMISKPEASTPTTEIETASTTTATTTASTTQTFLSFKDDQNSFDPKLFEDAVFSNRDLRIIFTRAGDFVFYYTFIDKETLLMATHPATLEEIIERLRSSRIIQNS